MCICVIEFLTTSSRDIVSQKITEEAKENQFGVKQKRKVY